jgi:O-antigen ligase
VILGTIPLFFSTVVGKGQTPPIADFSALSLAANFSVALDNLRDYPLLGVGPGGHPHSYEAQVPSWVYATSGLFGSQQQDGGALLIRLLSETGAIGTVLFLSGWLVVVLRARGAIQRALAFHREESSRPSLVLATSVGVTASCVALVMAYLSRMAIYYDPPIWVLIALTAAIPPLLKREYGERANARAPSEERGEVATSSAKAPRPSREA